MDHHLWRLAWALPLVLLIGVLFILALKRWGITRMPGLMQATGLMQANTPAPGLRVVADLKVSDDTRVYLLEAGGQRWLLTESRQQTSTQALPPPRTP